MLNYQSVDDCPIKTCIDFGDFPATLDDTGGPLYVDWKSHRAKKPFHVAIPTL